MKRFEFPLERALAMRRIDRDREVAKLEIALAAERAIQGKQAANEHDLSSGRQWRRAIQSAEAVDLAAEDAWRAHLLALNRRLDRDLEAARRTTAEQRVAVANAERRVRLIERLEQARRREWRSAVDRELEATAQELWLARWRNPRG